MKTIQLTLSDDVIKELTTAYISKTSLNKPHGIIDEFSGRILEAIDNKWKKLTLIKKEKG